MVRRTLRVSAQESELRRHGSHCNPSAEEGEAGRSGASGQSGKHRIQLCLMRNKSHP